MPYRVFMNTELSNIYKVLDVMKGTIWKNFKEDCGTTKLEHKFILM